MNFRAVKRQKGTKVVSNKSLKKNLAPSLTVSKTGVLYSRVRSNLLLHELYLLRKNLIYKFIFTSVSYMIILYMRETFFSLVEC